MGFVLFVFVGVSFLQLVVCSKLPVVFVTWSYPEATAKAWEVITSNTGNKAAVDAVEQGCNICEDTPALCHLNVGAGGIVDDTGEPTLDSMIMDGATHDVGAVGGLKNIKNAISVARTVMDYTRHSLMVGDSATAFASNFGQLPNESLKDNETRSRYENWKAADCQPNFWENVTPDPKSNCGPYTPSVNTNSKRSLDELDEDNHDTIGMVVVGSDGNVAVGTSTNGLSFKIAGRVGDSPIVGAGSYADSDVGGAAATGNGDIMMRFLPSYQAVENMRRGMTPVEACDEALSRIAYRYPTFDGALIAVNKEGDYGTACYGIPHYTITSRDPSMDDVIIMNKTCTVQPKKPTVTSLAVMTSPIRVDLMTLFIVLGVSMSL